MTADQLVLVYDDRRDGATRRRDTVSSKTAARTCGADVQRAQILRLLNGALDGFTADELAARMRPSPHRSSVAARLAQLRRDRMVEPYGVRYNGNGRPAQCWFALPSARQVDVQANERYL